MRGAGAVVAGALACVPLVSATAALAADGPTAVAADRQAWTWRREVLPAGLPVDEPSDVPPGDLAVAYDARPDPHPAKATYLHLDLTQLPAGATVSSLGLTLTLDPAAHSVDPGGERLVACRLLGDFTGGEGTDPATAPPEDCSHAVPGTYVAATASWTFSLTPFAAGWLDGSNHGLVVRPAPDATPPTDAPFQLVFAGGKAVRAEVAASAPTTAAVQPAPPAAGPSPAAGSQLPPAAVPLGAPVLPVAPVLPPAVPGPVPAPAAAPSPQPSPVVGAPPASPALAAPVLAAPRTTTGAVFGLGGLVALLLLAVSRMVGDTARPLVTARAERARLDRVRLPGPARMLPTVQDMQWRQGRRPRSSAAARAIGV